MESNKIIQHKGKPCIKASVVMLPTRDKSILSKAYLANPTYLRYNKNGFEYDSYHNNDNQHLYITLDEKPKEGEWQHNLALNIIEKCSKFHNGLLCKKIIATTDSKLTCKHSIGLHEVLLPQPSQSFIEAFVKANGVGFDEVLVEVTPSGVCYDMCNCEEDCLMMQKLSINQNHNTITIHPIKPQVYSREDVMLHLYNLAGNIAFKNSITIVWGIILFLVSLRNQVDIFTLGVTVCIIAEIINTII